MLALSSSSFGRVVASSATVARYVTRSRGSVPERVDSEHIERLVESVLRSVAGTSRGPSHTSLDGKVCPRRSLGCILLLTHSPLEHGSSAIASIGAKIALEFRSPSQGEQEQSRDS